MSIMISHVRDHSIAVDQTRCDTSIVAKYLDTSTVNNYHFNKTALPPDMTFTKDNKSRSDEQVEKFSRGFNSHYIACIESLLYLVSTIVYFSI